jgi:DNA repair protein RadA
MYSPNYIFQQNKELCIEEACSTVNKSNSKIKLLIVDSMMFHYRTEYPGRSNLSKRAERLNLYMHMLRICFGGVER